MELDPIPAELSFTKYSKSFTLYVDVQNLFSGNLSY